MRSLPNELAEMAKWLCHQGLPSQTPFIPDLLSVLMVKADSSLLWLQTESFCLFSRKMVRE